MGDPSAVLGHGLVTIRPIILTWLSESHRVSLVRVEHQPDHGPDPLPPATQGTHPHNTPPPKPA